MRNKYEGVVIAGIGGKFPESDNVLQLQERLFAKEDVITDTVRWTADTVGVGKIHDVDTFDAHQFKMHSKLVRASDPTTTQTLERAFEAIIDSGVNPFTMSGRNVAVISASMVSDSENTRAGSSYEASGFTIMGHNRGMVANRISYTLNFTGPSYSLHTSWGGGLRALQLGASLIAEGHTEAAIVTTASLIFHRATAKEYIGMSMAKPGGRCRSFDADADGTCRSEGVVSFFLQRASDAKRNYGSIVSIMSECIGTRECNLINFDSQLADKLRQFYDTNEIDPDDIAYLEADGCGIKKFDALELNALSTVFAGRRERPLLIGSTKSNVGNTEASSTFVGLTKSIVAMETGLIPPNLHYGRPNPAVPALLDGRFKPVTEATELPRGELFCVNALSLGGTAGHVVVKRNAKRKRKLTVGQLPPDGLPRLIVMSARNEEGAKANVKQLQTTAVDVEYASLVNDVFSTNILGYLWKSYVVVPSPEVKYNIKKYDNAKPPVWYVFSGMGSQWPKMGKDLLTLPIFAKSVDRCDKVLRPRGIDIRFILTTDDTSVFENILNCFVAIAVIQVGLVDIMRSVGLEPDGMVGHSVGELGCAYADGCFTAEQMVLAAYARGKASVETQTIPGMMAAVGLGHSEILARLPASVDVACHNASDSCTLSGPTDDVNQFVAALKRDGVFAKAVSAAGIAYHSRYIQSIGPKLLDALKELVPVPTARSTRWISSSVPESEWHTDAARLCSAEYHANNLLSSVLFEEACRKIPQGAILIEIAPHGLLQAILRRSQSTCVNISLTNRTADNGVRHLLNALGMLYLNNVNLDVNALYPAVEYPVSCGTPYLAPLVTWDHTDTWFHEFESIIKMMAVSSEVEIEIEEAAEDFSLWNEHCIEDQIVIPPSQILAYVWDLLTVRNKLDLKKEGLEGILIEDMVLSKQIIFQPFSQQLVTGITSGEQRFEVCLREKDESWERVVTGRIAQVATGTLKEIDNLKNDERDEVEVTSEEVLAVLEQFGYKLGPQFRAFKQITLKNKGFSATIEWTGNPVTFLDAVFKLIIFMQIESEQAFFYLSGFRKLLIDFPILLKLDKGSTVSVTYDQCTNIASCAGLILEGSKLTADPSVPRPLASLQWRAQTFLPFGLTLTMDELASVSVQLASEQHLSRWRGEAVVPITVLLTMDGSPGQTISTALQSATKAMLRTAVKIYQMDEKKAREKVAENEIQENRANLLVVGVYEAVRSIKGDMLRLAVYRESEQIKLKDDKSKLLFRHVLPSGLTIGLFSKGEPDGRLLEARSAGWPQEVGRCFNGGDDGSPLTLLLPMIGDTSHLTPDKVLPTIACTHYSHRVRCVFSDGLTRTKSSFVDLPVSHVVGGTQGVRCNLPIHLNTLPAAETHGLFYSSEPSLELDMVALNTNFLYEPGFVPEQVDVRTVDYCGRRDGGGRGRLMGVGRVDALSGSVAPDDSLVWPVPEDWTTEQAVTVPVAYSLAYYALVVRAGIKQGQSVLVLSAECPLGHAFVSVSLQLGANVYVTVHSTQQIHTLLKTFPDLNGDQVLVGCQFGTRLRLLRRGHGVQVVVNCLTGAGLSMAISCLGVDSSFFHLGSIDHRYRQTIGMGMFMKNSSFFGVSLSNVTNADGETKRRLQTLVADGVVEGAVRPLERAAFALNDYAAAVGHLKNNSSLEKTVVVLKDTNQSENGLTRKTPDFHCLPNCTYIVVGGSVGDLWLEAAQWLVRRGAHKLVLALADLGPAASRRLARLTALCHLRLVLTSAARLDSAEDAALLLRDATTLGQVDAVFFVEMEANSARVSHGAQAASCLSVRPRHIVSLLGGAQPSVRQVTSDRPLATPRTLFTHLSSALASPANTLIVSDVAQVAAHHEGEHSSGQPASYLPSGIAELSRVCAVAGDRQRLRQAVTRSPGHAAVRHCLLPVFVVPGMSAADDATQSFLRNLIHPAYCADLPSRTKSVQHTAQVLLEEVLKIQSKGPYNVVGESWGGAVALELATLLESKGHQVELFLLDAAPETAKSRARALTSEALLTRLFALDPTSSKRLSEMKGWEDQLTWAEAQAKGNDKRECASAHLAANALRIMLQALLADVPDARVQFKGAVHLLRTRHASDVDFCGLKMYCQQRPNIYVLEEETHKEMMQSQSSATIVNKNILYTWDI